MSAPTLGFSREGEVVTLRMTSSDWDNLLIVMGAGAHAIGLPRALELVNRLNAGNPEFRPYSIPEGEEHK